jgi:hypothetical protein
MTPTRWMVAAFALALTVANALAQDRTAMMIRQAGPQFWGISGAAFSADYVEISDRFAADGTPLHTEIKGAIFRDAEGRMRTERYSPAGIAGEPARVQIEIIDPVLELNIHLYPENKSVLVEPERYRGSLPWLAFDQNRPTPKKTTRPTHSGFEILETSAIEGFAVKGSRCTDVRAPMQGTDKPSVAIRESWLSKDLMVFLHSEEESPWIGKRSIHVMNIHTGNPDPLMFQIPPDYRAAKPASQ